MSRKNEKFHQQACSFEGYLHKKSPQIFVGYQKRFFCIRDNGKKLVYYKDKPNIKDKPKGVIEISDIIDIVVHDATEFYITYAERKFELKAASKQERDKWIQMLKYLKEFVFEEDNTNLKVSFSNADSDESMNLSPSLYHNHSKFLTKEKQKWRMANLDTQTLNNIQAENEINILKNTNETTMSDSVLLPNNTEQLLELKGIAEYIRRIDSNIVDPRMCCGFLNKKGKTNLTKYKKRWFILISDNILEAESNADPEKIIVDSQLPPWMRLNTIYYFKYDKPDDKSNFIGKIALKKIKNVVLEGINEEGNTFENLGKGILNFGANFGKIFGFDAATFKKPEHGYGFRLEADNRIYYLYADLVTEMNKWVVAIYRAMNSIQIKDSAASSRSLTVDSKDDRSRTTTIRPDENNFKTIAKPGKPNDYDDKSPQKYNSVKSRQTLSSRDPSSMSLDSSRIDELKISTNNSVKEGYIDKKSSNKLVGWQQRWVVLKRDSLLWFRSNNDKNPQNAVPIINIKQCLSLKDNEFMILVGEKTVKFKTEESEERDAWVHTINNIMLNKGSDDLGFLDRTKTEDIVKPSSRRESGEAQNKFSKYFSLDEKSIKGDEKPKRKNSKTKENAKTPVKSVNEEEFVPFHPGTDFLKKKKGKSCWSRIFCCCVQEEEDNYYMKYN